ncbi:unnamed protein product [Closterium sp. NIES-64]|nr:unnamed protein product [Closterium sp. NIES-64]
MVAIYSRHHDGHRHRDDVDAGYGDRVAAGDRLFDEDRVFDGGWSAVTTSDDARFPTSSSHRRMRLHPPVNPDPSSYNALPPTLPFPPGCAFPHAVLPHAVLPAALPNPSPPPAVTLAVGEINLSKSLLPNHTLLLAPLNYTTQPVAGQMAASPSAPASLNGFSTRGGGGTAQLGPFASPARNSDQAALPIQPFLPTFFQPSSWRQWISCPWGWWGRATQTRLLCPNNPSPESPSPLLPSPSPPFPLSPLPPLPFSPPPPLAALQLASMDPMPVAVVGPRNSDQAALVSPLAAFAQVGREGRVEPRKCGEGGKGIPFVSPSATDVRLTAGGDRPYFMRTIHNDGMDMRAIAEFLAFNKWSEVIVIHSDNRFGRNGIASLNGYLSVQEVRIATRVPIKTTWSVADTAAALAAVERLDPAVFVVHAAAALCAVIFSAANQMQLVGKNSVWVASEGAALVNSTVLQNVEVRWVAGGSLRVWAPGVGAPGVGAPGVGAPGVGAPGVGAPGVGAPRVGAPGVGAPGVGAPGVGAPGVGAPGVGAPGGMVITSTYLPPSPRLTSFRENWANLNPIRFPNASKEGKRPLSASRCLSFLPLLSLISLLTPPSPPGAQVVHDSSIRRPLPPSMPILALLPFLPLLSHLPPFPLLQEPKSYTLAAYDATYLIAWGLHSLLYVNHSTATTGSTSSSSSSSSSSSRSSSGSLTQCNADPSSPSYSHINRPHPPLSPPSHSPHSPIRHPHPPVSPPSHPLPPHAPPPPISSPLWPGTTRAAAAAAATAAGAAAAAAAAAATAAGAAAAAAAQGSDASGCNSGTALTSSPTLQTDYRNAVSRKHAPQLRGLKRSLVGPMLRQAMLSATFDGVRGRITLNSHGDLQSNVTRILNVINGTAMPVGFWTSSLLLTPSLDLPPMNGTSRILNITFPGNTTKPPSGAFPRRKLLLAVPYKKGFQQFVNITSSSASPPTNETASYSFSGFTVELFRLAVSKLPYKADYELVPFVGDDGGGADAAVGYDDMLQAVADEKFDGAIGDISVTQARSKLVDFTQPFMASAVSVIAYVPPSSSWWMALAPFTPSMWAAFLGMTFATGLITVFLECRQNWEFQGKLHELLQHALWFGYLSIFSFLEKPVRTLIARIVLALWLLVTFVVVTSFTANMTSIITVNMLTVPSLDVNSVINANNPIAYQAGSFIEGYLTQLGVQKHNMVPLNSAEEYNSALVTGRVKVVVDEDPYLDLLRANHCSMAQVRQPYSFLSMSFAFQKGSQLRRDISAAILHLTMTGELDQLQQDYLLGGTRLCPDTLMPEAPAVLANENFWGLFVGYAVVSLACCLLYVGLLVFRGAMVARELSRQQAKSYNTDMVEFVPANQPANQPADQPENQPAHVALAPASSFKLDSLDLIEELGDEEEDEDQDEDEDDDGDNLYSAHLKGDHADDGNGGGGGKGVKLVMPATPKGRARAEAQGQASRSDVKEAAGFEKSKKAQRQSSRPGMKVAASFVAVASLHKRVGNLVDRFQKGQEWSKERHARASAPAITASASGITASASATSLSDMASEDQPAADGIAIGGSSFGSTTPHALPHVPIGRRAGKKLREARLTGSMTAGTPRAGDRPGARLVVRSGSVPDLGPQAGPGAAPAASSSNKLVSVLRSSKQVQKQGQVIKVLPSRQLPAPGQFSGRNFVDIDADDDDDDDNVDFGIYEDGDSGDDSSLPQLK